MQRLHQGTFASVYVMAGHGAHTGRIVAVVLGNMRNDDAGFMLMRLLMLRVLLCHLLVRGAVRVAKGFDVTVHLLPGHIGSLLSY